MKETDAWDIVKIARDPNRLTGRDFIENVFEDFFELHGDRCYGDDPALIGGLAFLDKQPVMLLAQERGKGPEDEITHNFGMVKPEGYRKSLRLFKQAEKFSIPVVCLIDTPGASSDIGSEYRGQANSIAYCLRELAMLKTPVVSIILGQGGSGGALALAVAGVVYMFEYSVYSILSPEGFANILFKDPTKKVEAAKVMKLTARDLYSLGVIDGIIPEKPDGNWHHPEESYHDVKEILLKELDLLMRLSPEELVARRMARFQFIAEK